MANVVGVNYKIPQGQYKIKEGPQSPASQKPLTTVAIRQDLEQRVQRISSDYINDVLEENTNYHTQLISDYNTNLGRKKYDAETSLGIHGFDERNERGSRLLNILQEHGLYSMNYFFVKRLQRKWTWISPDGKPKNDMDYIITNRKEKVYDVES
ncbi:hypothetical protein HUJ04_011048 [Dendroctonus ponderosae]|uniref:Uncharacterized protein n=1 Tax=Dendroctonus ponderosae TaxID=77166 RepID=A0AAR5PZN4_DENPD|nr:hypothetical protein HUJ04_011048 [Dendroctonus ponderosae]